MVYIILICINNFQPYILDNIKQLIKFDHKNIHVITNEDLFKNFKDVSNYITLVNCDELDDYGFNNSSKLDKQFRNGFWHLTSLRFFYLLSYIKKNNLTNIFHIENDVLLYYNVNIIINKLDNQYIYIPFDTYKRNIASIMFIPNYSILEKCLNLYNNRLNDMQNFYYIMKRTKLITQFPIFNDETNNNKEIQFISTNFNKLYYIFDAAAIGQYLGGIDPRNTSGDTCGFVNETCIIKYNNYKIVWKIVDEQKNHS